MSRPAAPRHEVGLAVKLRAQFEEHVRSCRKCTAITTIPESACSACRHREELRGAMMREEREALARLGTVFCDGGQLSPNPSRVGGSWAWGGVEGVDTKTVEVFYPFEQTVSTRPGYPGGVSGSQPLLIGRSGYYLPTPAVPLITNNYAEFCAILRALEALPDGWSGRVASDSRVALSWVFECVSERFLPRPLIQRAGKARGRLGELEPMNLSGHPSVEDINRGLSRKRGLPVSQHQDWCDKACTSQKLVYRELVATRVAEARHEEVVGV